MMNSFKKRIAATVKPAEAEQAAIQEELQSASGGRNAAYLNGRAEWLERYGNYINRANQWRLCAFFLLVISLFLAVANIVQLTRTDVVRYFVTVDELGKTIAEKISDSQHSSTPEPVVQAVIADFITNWRSVTPDTELQKRMMGYLSSHTASAARGVLKEWFEQNSPYKTAKEGRMVSVEIKGKPLAVTSDSYRVEWTEIVRNLQGSEMIKERFEAILTVTIIPPKDDETMLANPGGVYVINISTAKVLH